MYCNNIGSSSNYSENLGHQFIMTNDEIISRTQPKPPELMKGFHKHIILELCPYCQGVDNFGITWLITWLYQ